MTPLVSAGIRPNVKMTIAPDKPKTKPIQIPDTLPPLDDPFWKPYREPETPNKPAPPKEEPGGPGGPDKPKKPRRPTKQ